MPLALTERRLGPVTLLELHGRLTADAAGELRERIEALLAAGKTQLLLDCRGVETVDSFGMGTLVRSSVTVGRHRGRFGLVSPSEKLQQALELTGLRSVLECFDNIGDALRSF